MRATRFRFVTAAAIAVLVFAGTSPSHAIPGFAQVGPGAGDILNNCANASDAPVEQRLDACTQAVESTAWHGTAWPYLFRSRTYREIGKDDLALADLNDAIKIARLRDPLLPVVYHDRCDMRAQNSRDLNGALSDCNKSLEIRPNNAPTLYSRAVVEYALSDYAAAVADCTAALALKPDDAEVQDLLKRAKTKSPQTAVGSVTPLGK